MLLELVMIVKNSGEILRKCLKSVKPYINQWTILDTGSSDNTPIIIEEELREIPGNIYYSDFIDFSTTRNKAFELSKKNCKYQIILDDSYELHGGEDLLKILKKSKKDAFSIKIGKYSEDYKLLDDNYYSMRIVKSDCEAKYFGRVHEVIHLPIECKDEHITNDKIFINDLPDKGHDQRSSNRFLNDIILLKKDFSENPYDDRILIHLANTFICLEKYEDALNVFYKIMSISKNKEYIYFSSQKIAEIEYLEYSKENLYNSDVYLHRMSEIYKIFPERRGESGYKIASILCEKSKYKEALEILLNICRIKKPNLLVTNLQTAIYDFYIPYLYIDLNLKLGNLELAIEMLKKMLSIYPKNHLLLNIKYAITENSNKIITLQKKVIVIHMGTFFYAWNPCNNLEISGSEYSAINLAKEFIKMDYQVFLFGQFCGENKNGELVNYEYCDKNSNIQYIDNNKFVDFIENYYIDYLIISRFSENLIYRDNIKNVYLWLHDILPINKGLPIQINFKSFRGVITLSEWHKNYVKNKLGAEDKYMILLRNAIYPERFLNKNQEKIPYKFIYTSDPERGLDNLISIIQKIHKKFPETTLKIFTRIENIKSETLKIIKSLDFVSLNNRISQENISLEFLSSDVWLYPTDFKETYCISALEAMASGCLVCTLKLAGLQDICKDNRGILCSYPYNENEMFKKISYVLENNELKNNYIQKAREWALDQTYSSLAKDWIKLFE